MPSLRSIHWLTTLSLDAPLVALAWQELISETSGTKIDIHHRILIFASVWLGYSADRWIDSIRYKETKSTRHLFHKKHRYLYLSIWLGILLSSLTLARIKLEPAELTRGFILVVASLIATFLVQAKIFGAKQNWPKSILTALLITASSTLFTIPQSGSLNFDYIFLFAVPFGLFLVNCLLIHNWDKELDISHQEGLGLECESLKKRLIATFVITEVLAIYSYFIFSPKLFLAATLSFTLLFLLQKKSDRIHLDTRRTLADLALLSPFLLIAL
ncbi:hypothetical protein MLD52_04635 [Puniceicoccaceae bacterium K14]|nr:hypothetical protein [Puniceicoccaceae bacterium K14]